MLTVWSKVNNDPKEVECTDSIRMHQITLNITMCRCWPCYAISPESEANSTWCPWHTQSSDGTQLCQVQLSWRHGTWIGRRNHDCWSTPADKTPLGFAMPIAETQVARFTFPRPRKWTLFSVRLRLFEQHRMKGAIPAFQWLIWGPNRIWQILEDLGKHLQDLEQWKTTVFRVSSGLLKAQPSEPSSPVVATFIPTSVTAPWRNANKRNKQHLYQ